MRVYSVLYAMYVCNQFCYVVMLSVSCSLFCIISHLPLEALLVMRSYAFSLTLWSNSDVGGFLLFFSHLEAILMLGLYISLIS